MKVNWIVEDVFGYDLSPLIKEIGRQGHKVKLIDHLKGPYSSKDLFPFNEPCVFYGSLQEAQSILREGSYIPGVLCSLWSRFNCLSYYDAFGPYLFNSKYRIASLKETFRMMAGDKFFIRPNSGSKTFSGQVVDKESLNSFMRREHLHDSDMLVVSSSAKNITGEYRFVIYWGSPIACSSYPEKHEMPSYVRDYVNEVALQIDKINGNPYILYTMDVAVSPFDIGVLEIGCISTSALYHCDLAPIVEAMSKVALDEWDLYQGLDVD